MAALIVPSTDFELKLYQARNFTKSFRRVRRDDQSTVVPLDGYTSGLAQLRTKAGGALLLDFAVEINTVTDRCHVTATAEQTSPIERGGVFDCVLFHSNGVDTLVMCPPVKMVLVKAVSLVD